MILRALMLPAGGCKLAALSIFPTFAKPLPVYRLVDVYRPARMPGESVLPWGGIWCSCLLQHQAITSSAEYSLVILYTKKQL